VATDLMSYPRPKLDNGWGLHDSANLSALPGDIPLFVRELAGLGMTWFKVLAGGRNKVPLVRELVKAGIEPIIRLYSYKPHPAFVVNYEDVQAYVREGAHYFEWGNEPNLRMEWPDEAWAVGARVDRVCEQFIRNADVIRAAGGIPLFPALSPGGDYPHRDWYRTTFAWFLGHHRLNALEGAALAIHNRPLNHPLDYRDESGCHFLDYEWIDEQVRLALGHSLPLLATEAGYEPYWDQDPNFPKIDLAKHAAYNAEILRRFDPARVDRWEAPLFCQCMWLGNNLGHHEFAGAAWLDNSGLGGKDLPVVALVREEATQRRFVKCAPLPYSQKTFQSSRDGWRPRAIIIHDTVGSAEAALAWWQAPGNPDKSSAHIIVTAGGEYLPAVPLAKAAHHSGGSISPIPGVPSPAINQASIGIELEHPASGGPWPEIQLERAAALVRGLMREFTIGPGEVFFHREIDQRKQDPRGIDKEDFMSQVVGVEALQGAEERARASAWDVLGIPLNPDAAFPKAAREHDLGNPVTPEFDFMVNDHPHRGQGFSRGIVYCRVGSWGDVKIIEW
jgi:hypothetical protein